MRHRLALAGFALLFVVCSAQPAAAQFRNMRFPASLQNVFMLNGEAVQKELGLTDEQKKTISQLSDQMRADALEIMSGLQDLSPEEQKEHMPELMKMVGDKGKEMQAKIDQMLDKKQVTRLKELSLQNRGAQALEDDEVIAALKITDDQKKKLTDVREEGAKKMEETMQSLRSGGGDQGEIRQKLMAMRKELGDKALAVLTSEQRQQFDKMKGPKFEFPPNRGFGF
jgi:Spy/CpxP family protein refolding chaperone